MKLKQTKSMRSALGAATIGALALSLGACGPQQPADNAGQNPHSSANPMISQQSDHAPDRMASQQPGQAADSMDKRPQESAGMLNSKPANPEASADDQALTGKVKSALISESKLKLEPIKVEAQKGVVTLSGKVSSDADRQEAIKIASNVDGVKAVKDNMVIEKSS